MQTIFVSEIDISRKKVKQQPELSAHRGTVGTAHSKPVVPATESPLRAFALQVLELILSLSFQRTHNSQSPSFLRTVGGNLLPFPPCLSWRAALVHWELSLRSCRCAVPDHPEASVCLGCQVTCLALSASLRMKPQVTLLGPPTGILLFNSYFLHKVSIVAYGQMQFSVGSLLHTRCHSSWY